MKQDCCFCFYVHYKLKETHFILFFNTKRYAAYLYTLAPLEKQVRLAFSWRVCHLKQIKQQDPRMSRMHHIRTSCKYWMVLTWDILFESADQEIFLFFSPLFLSQACTFWLKAHKIAKQMHCVYYLLHPLFFFFLLASNT